MSLLLATILVVGCVTGVLIILFLRPASWRCIAAALTAVVLLALLIGVYITQPGFRVTVDSYLRPDTYHLDLGGKAEPLPLPPRTGQQFRFSETGAAYFSRCSPNEVSQFYARLVGPGDLDSGGSGEQGTCFRIRFQDDTYSIRITARGKDDSLFWVDSGGDAGCGP